MSEERHLLSEDPAQLVADHPTLLQDLAALTGIQIPEEHIDAVRAHLSTAANMAKLLYAAPLDDNALDSAAVFTPEDVSSEGHDD